MNVSINWLEQYMEGPFEGKDLEKRLTDLGLEVEDVKALGDGFEKVVVGRIESIEKHPDADKLKICQLNVGAEENLTIVTAADNIYEGMVVPVALVGARVIGGDIKVSSLRGVESFGMLCSGEELGIDNSLLSDREKEGILPLSEEAPLGMDIKEWMGLDDVVLDIGLTPNRSDCLGIYNIAREVSMSYHKPLSFLKVNEGEEGGGDVAIDIDEESLCHRYVGRIVREVKIGPSPAWFQNLLRNVGVRPINNLVDITNYVMFELGHPMHAFDLNTLEGKKISVKTAKGGESFTTLDGVERTLDAGMILICDEVKPVALGGVMGGLNSEVTDQTTSILLEAAWFSGESIRKTSRKLGLRSEASSRFEKGISEENCLLAMNRAAHLIEQLGMGRVEEGYVDTYPVKQEIKTITCSIDSINQLLGMTIPEKDMANIFLSLGFTVEEQGDVLYVTPLAHRIDIQREVDLAEEVIRVYGYEELPATLPVDKTNTFPTPYPILLRDEVKGRMIGMGFNEIVSYSFIDPSDLVKTRLSEGDDFKDPLQIMNPLSESQSVMRMDLLPGLLVNASRNYRRQQRTLALFEVGRVFKDQGETLPREELHLGALLTEKGVRSWYSKENIDFFTLKGVVERMLGILGVEEVTLKRETNAKTYHPGRCGWIYGDGTLLGIIGELHPQVRNAYDIKERTYYFELNLDNIKRAPVVKYRGLPKYPSVERDMAFIVPKKTTIAQIEEVIKGASHKKVVHHQLFDVYEGNQIGEGYKSIAYGITYQDPEKTLTDEEVSKIHQDILSALEIELDAKLR